ncbi:MAG: ABC transporter ATP-binding protein [Liquorilactobacillus nagelii]|jgi:putative ABC transport system ATP-binding protein|uniref:ABC transporter ATP-binding protein n=1 Tax=Liquorilactobacillus nagelii TaxID=82688 RepID=UPI0006EFCD15|nr:ABC transporter ATP-binding protein [Liquorilactobacillus nagelii]KRL40315.1 ABC transporter, ATP-binding protein [Liquorilactobacillus nagelii DSM 13675]MCI1633514.1 ABC transporter ATP-binding protein [Liquorilactobacillus nagelii]MCI1922474.1 ABC transporter ATP-binding protein [Liquorilactobacillus nagelii]MCI1977672.1 ABC transporter ATP-binding protein [Liquorilactobacillus nagelii]QYH54790.1 ABC transporter ATP-binding protein [Liquorilactobacillus nagelii DSM 13675]
MTNVSVIQAQHLQKVYGKKQEKKYTALKDVSFEVQSGDFVGVMGASGSGKTTLLNMLATFDRPTSGTVTIADRDVTSLQGNALADFRAEQMGFIFQDFNLLDNLTVAQNIGLPLSLQGRTGKLTEKVAQIASSLGIKALLEKYPAQLSGGQKQRVACARALINQPKILFGDEPTGALDSKSARSLLELLQEINQQRQTAILLVTHDAFSASFCRRIIFIKDGQIGHELVRQPQQSRTEFYQQILDQLGTFEQ